MRLTDDVGGHEGLVGGPEDPLELTVGGVDHRVGHRAKAGDDVGDGWTVRDNTPDTANHTMAQLVNN